jgi:transposase
MRTTTMFRQILGIVQLFVDDVWFEPEGLILSVRPRWRRPRCVKCGRRGPGYDTLPTRRWRHLSLGKLKIWLEYAPRRVNCSHCGTCRVEQVPWAAHGSRFTRDFEELVAYLAQVTDITHVTKMVGVAWSTVGHIVERVVSKRLDSTRLDNLRRIGVDEFSYRKRHRYLTTVVDHDARRVIWAAPGRSAETLSAFFELLGLERCSKIESVTIDMSGGYQKAIQEYLPNAQIVFDRFHVQQLATNAVDEVRREQLRELRGTEEGDVLFRSRFALLKNGWDLSRDECAKLADIQRDNARLYRGYLLKESLRKALNYRQPARAKRALKSWLAWASRSKLKPFVRTARTIRKHFTGILAYIKTRLTNGVVEGINTRLRMIARRAYGFHSPEALISMLYLCCGGITLSPPLPEPT